MGQKAIGRGSWSLYESFCHVLLNERNKTIILLRVSTVAKQGPKGRAKRPAQRFRQDIPLPFLFGLSERNKIKILLRSKYICVIISVSSHLRGFFYEALFRLSADSA